MARALSPGFPGAGGAPFEGATACHSRMTEAPIGGKITDAPRPRGFVRKLVSSILLRNHRSNDLYHYYAQSSAKIKKNPELQRAF